MANRGVKKPKFREDFGVFVCEHVLNDNAKVLQVTRDLEGDWQFTCGDDVADETSDLHLLAVGELLQRDISLSDAVVLEPGQGIERAATYKDWDTFALEE